MIAENHKSAHVYALHNKSLDSPQTFRLDIEESRTCSVLLALNGILMVNIIQMCLFFILLDILFIPFSLSWHILILQVLGIVLIYLTTDILMAKPCDLKKALDLLGLDVNSPCAYNDIMDKLSTLCYWGIGMISVDLILFLMLSTPFKRPFCIFVSNTFLYKSLTLTYLFICWNILNSVTKFRLVHRLLLLQLLFPQQC